MRRPIRNSRSHWPFSLHRQAITFRCGPTLNYTAAMSGVTGMLKTKRHQGAPVYRLLHHRAEAAVAEIEQLQVVGPPELFALQAER